jgi:repressor LexA
MPRKPSYLTGRQKEILEFVAQFQASSGIAPTHREICEHFGYSSYGTVYKHLKLLGQKGFLRRDWNQKRGLELLREAPRPKAGAAEIPFLGRIAAGRPIEAVDPGESLQVPGHLLGSQAEEHYVLRVAGDSMIEEGIHDGDYVVVRRRDTAETGAMVVALLGSDATLKRYYPEGDTVRLQPANAALQPLIVATSEVAVQGVVVGLMRRY